MASDDIVFLINNHVVRIIISFMDKSNKLVVKKIWLVYSKYNKDHRFSLAVQVCRHYLLILVESSLNKSSVNSSSTAILVWEQFVCISNSKIILKINNQLMVFEDLFWLVKTKEEPLTAVNNNRTARSNLRLT